MVLGAGTMFAKHGDTFTVEPGRVVVVFVDERSFYVGTPPRGVTARENGQVHGHRMVGVKNSKDAKEVITTIAAVSTFAAGTILRDVPQTLSHGTFGSGTAVMPPLTYLAFLSPELYEARIKELQELANNTKKGIETSIVNQLLAADAVRELREKMESEVQKSLALAYEDRLRAIEAKLASLK